MGDRIKFGPEWLRNLAPGTSGNNNQNAAMPTSTTPSGGTSAGTSAENTVSSFSSGNVEAGNTSNTTSKVLLAKLRYGREEMLALYDRTSDAPPELKYIDTIYQSRGKLPFALNNSFEDDVRENMRSGPPIGVVSTGERFGLGRGMGRGVNISDGRGRPRVPFVRQPPTGRGSTWHHGNPKMPGFSGGADDDSSLNLRSSWSASNGANQPNRNSGEQAEWIPNKTFRSKRQGQATNWRQSREEGEEWRSADASRSRNSQQEKWERDWGDRPTQDKNQSWNSNRRAWVGGDTQNEENLPEWAVDSAEACGGTFDSSGAFHGYSNDDTNLPKTMDTSYPLTRSHTHGSFSRSKATDESSDEWWSSDKAKKLSPKRFEASDVKYRKQISAPESSDPGSDSAKTTKDVDQQEFGNRKPHRGFESLESLTSSEQTDNASGGISDDEKFNKKTRDAFKPKYSESNTFDALMRSDINLEEASDERGNFQSVMITPNNSLRQKHQNIVSSASDMPMRDSNSNKQGLLQMLQGPVSHQPMENDNRKRQSPEDKIVDEIFDMTLEEKDLLTKSQQMASPLGNNQTPTSSGMSSMSQMQNPAMQLRHSNPVYANAGLMSGKPNMPSGMQMPTGLQGHPGMPVNMQGLPAGLQIGVLPPSLQVAGMQPLGMQGPGNQAQGMSSAGMQQTLQSGMQQSMQGTGMQGPGIQGSMQQGLQPVMQGPGMQGNMQPMQSVGITNSALNASLGLPIGPTNNQIGIPMQGVPTPGMGNPGIGGGLQGPMGGGQMQPGGPGMAGFPNPVIPGASLFLGQNANNQSMGNSGDIPMPNHGNHNNMYQMHGLQPSGSQGAFGSSIYSNMMQPPPTQPPPNQQIITEQWFYEDPEKNIQGPFSSKDMYNWYRAGFFNPSLMVRRACDAHMRPLGSYGLIVPFAHIDVVNYPLSGGFNRSPGPHESMLNPQQALGLENVMNMPNLNDAPSVSAIQFGSVGLIPNPPFGPQQPMVDSLWSQPSPSADLMWMQQGMPRNDNRVNNLPLYFWEQQLLQFAYTKGEYAGRNLLLAYSPNYGYNFATALAPNALLPDGITKEMKTEDQILAQLRASQNISAPQNISFMNDPPIASAAGLSDDPYVSPPSATPNMEELQKLIQKDSLASKSVNETGVENIEVKHKPEKVTKVEQTNEVNTQNIQYQQPSQPPQLPPPQLQQPTKQATETKQVKLAKECDKPAKAKESISAKPKNKKKDDKKDDLDTKTKEDEHVRPEKRSDEPSPSKSKKEDKANKKELDKEKKEWLKEGFTIVKGSEKNAYKDKKKAEEAKAVEEAERKRKEDDKLAADDDKKKKQADATRKQQENQQQQQRQAADSVVKKAPWSTMGNQSMFASNKDGLSLNEIQRLEREKKLEQMKEQQQMMQIIAHQQAATLAREQEMQAGLGWAKKKGINVNAPGQSLAEIQAEARKQAAAAAVAVAAAAAAQAMEEAAQPPVISVPWGGAANGVGFWDMQPNQPSKSTDRPHEQPKAAEPKPKKKITVQAAPKKEVPPKKEAPPKKEVPLKKEAPPKKETLSKKEANPKKETSPVLEFESWCTTVLTSWSSKIDVPTFVGFLKDIESPYEVKDYVKCYLGESKDSGDFARQFLERRSKLLRVGMVTPSDDLCSPAIAVNPRTSSGSDYQEVKGKGKKTKKNKMLKIDARILGFSVTAAEDRINVGDIDSV